MSGNSFLLKAGKTYELDCALEIANGLYTQYGWTDASNAVVGDVRSYGKSTSPTYAFNIAPQTVAKAVITPVADMYVHVRVLYADGTSTDLANVECWATVRQLP